MTAFDIAAEQKQMERKLYRAQTRMLALHKLGKHPSRDDLHIFFSCAGVEQWRCERIARHAREAFTCFCRVGPFND